MYGQAQAQTRFNLYHFSIVFSPIQKGANIVLPALTSSTISTVPTDGLFRLSKSAWNINLIGSRLMWAASFPTQMVERNGCLTRSERLPRTHCHTYQSVPDHCSFKMHLTFHPICRIFQIFSTTLRISYTCHLVHFYLVCGVVLREIG